MLKKITSFFLLGSMLLVCFLLSGCQQPEEINDMTIFSGAAVDYNQDQKLYQICAEIMDPSSSGEDSENKQLLRTSGVSFPAAVNSCNVYSEKTVHWSHAKDMILSKELAQTVGISPILNFLINDNQFRLSTDLLLYDQGKADDFFKLDKQNGYSQLFQVENLLRRSERTGNGSPLKAYEAMNLLNTEGIQISMPILSVSDSKPFLNGTAVFRGDKFVGQLTREETQLLSLLQSKDASYTLTLPDGRVTLALENVSTKWHPSQSTHQLEMTAQIEADALLSSYEPMPQNETAQLEKQVEDQLTKNLSALTTHIQKDLQSDILGTGSRIKNKFPQQWDILKHNWDESSFTTLPINIHCRITLQTGETHL